LKPQRPLSENEGGEKWGGRNRHTREQRTQTYGDAATTKDEPSIRRKGRSKPAVETPMWDYRKFFPDTQGVGRRLRHCHTARHRRRELFQEKGLHRRTYDARESDRKSTQGEKDRSRSQRLTLRMFRERKAYSGQYHVRKRKIGAQGIIL